MKILKATLLAIVLSGFWLFCGTLISETLGRKAQASQVSQLGHAAVVLEAAEFGEDRNSPMILVYLVSRSSNAPNIQVGSDVSQAIADMLDAGFRMEITGQRLTFTR